MFNNDSDYKRKPAWAGAFYEANPKRLDRIVTDYLKSAPQTQVNGQIIGVVVPHAGYVYSGPTAAAAYKLLVGQHYDSVIVIAPSHHEVIKGVSVFSGQTYETPLGEVQIDSQLAQEIVSSSQRINFSIAGHLSEDEYSEHSLEVQLPFLQKVFPAGMKMVPIVFHDYSVDNCRELGEAIFNAVGDRTVLIVASSDLYHGYSYEECLATDERTLSAVEAMDPKDFCHGLKTGAYQACGGGPIAALQFAAQKMGADFSKVVARTNSADVTGMRGGWTVGYAAVVVGKSAD